MKITARVFLGFLLMTFILALAEYLLFNFYQQSSITAGVIKNPSNSGIFDSFFTKENILFIPTLFFISLILIALATILISRSIILPIKELKKRVSESIIENNEDNIILNTNDEIQDLAKTIDNQTQENRKIFKELLDNANDLIQCVNPEGKFVYVNKKWLSVLGYSPEDLKKINLTDILRKDQIPHCMELFKRVCEGESLTNINTIFISKNKKEIPLEGNVTPRLKNGRFISTVAIFRDATQKKKAENELKKKADEIEKLNRFMINREIKMKELKKEIEELHKD